MAVGGEGEFRKRIACLNGDRLRKVPMSGRPRRQSELCTRDEPAGIFNSGIGGEQFEPPSSAAQMLARKSPKRVAGLNNDECRWRWRV